MDSEIILLEQLLNDEIDTCCLSPFLSILVYLFIICVIFPMNVDNSITNIFIVVIVLFTFNSYKRDYDLLMKYLCY
jgi:hypothetical protein